MGRRYEVGNSVISSKCLSIRHMPRPLGRRRVLHTHLARFNPESRYDIRKNGK
jgi:hypothetical protein